MVGRNVVASSYEKKVKTIIKVITILMIATKLIIITKQW